MNRNLLLIVTLAVSAFACGGGGGSNPPVQPLVASFAPANANPGANTLSMSGTTTGSAFAVQVNVTGITDFFGAGFHVSFDPATASFSGFTPTGSVLGTNPADTEFHADLVSPGEVAVAATKKGQVQGTNVAGTQLLLTLNFTATGVTNGNAFTFGSAVERLVTTCPAPPTACTELPDNSLTWSGGTMTATR
jgi:cohesin domain-containing protein